MAYRERVFSSSSSKNYFPSKLLVNHGEKEVGDELTVSNSWEGDYSSSVDPATRGES